MSTAVLEEIVEKAAALTSEERNKLSIDLLEQYKTELDEQSGKLISEKAEENLRLLEAALSELKQLLKNSKQHTSKNTASPNIEWLKKNQAEYAGNYVSLKNGELIAVGRTIKEADQKAKAKGFDKTLLHYIPAEDEEVWGGW